MLRLNSDQAKHAASSLRIIAMAQFASYGYMQWKADIPQPFVFTASLGVYVLLEGVALWLLGRGEDG